MSISVITGSIARKSGALFRVLIVLAILAQGSLFVHYHASASAVQAQAITQQ
jgi:hypothetical protein